MTKQKCVIENTKLFQPTYFLHDQNIKIRYRHMPKSDRWKTGHKQVKNLLTVFDPCGRLQPETDLFELWRLDGSRLTLRVDGEGNKEREEKCGSQKGQEDSEK